MAFAILFVNFPPIGFFPFFFLLQVGWLFII